MLPIIAIFVVFIFLMIIPQRKRKKQMQTMLDSLAPGKMIKTIGGIYGKIVAVKEDLITIEVLPDKVRMVFAKGAVATVEDADVEDNTLDRK
ncbi:MAG: preprotein translocase subunit YajC [Eubacteriales bacterium]|nr:preprotein translocase subunit YajC [Eubacteriales bacterium]